MARRLIVSFLFASLAITAFAQPPAKRRLTIADFASIREVGSPQLSPSGEEVLYTVKQPNLTEDKSHTHLWISSWDGSRTRQLTFSKESESSPRWSPDGKLIAFISGRGADDEIDQLWIIRSDGGEAERVTELKGSVADFDWSPDGRRLVLAVEDAEPETPAPASAAGEKKKEKTKPPIVISRFQFKQDKIGYLTTKRQHLSLFDLEARKVQPLTSGEFSEYLPSYSPDGARIAFVSKHGDDPDRTDNWDIFVIDAKAGSAPRQLTTYEGADLDPEKDSRPAWSPDGKLIAYVQGGTRELIYYAVRHLAVIPSAGGEPRLLAAQLDRNVEQPHFSSDGKTIFFILEDDRSNLLAKVPTSGGAMEIVVGGKRSISAFDVARDRLIVLCADDQQPSEIFAAASTPRQITHQNRDLLDTVMLGVVEELDFKSKDGTPIHGFVVKPPQFDTAIKYPAVLRIHGGPVSQFSHHFSFEWQLLAANGFVVVAANPRGSSGRGEEFSKAIWADWGNKDVLDVLAAVDAAVAKGYADPARLAVGGWSYGGMLTNYVIAQDNRFKAATSGASIANAFAGYGTDQYVREYELELGRPWEHPDLWMRVSFPFLHADRIKTPTLFLAGEKDFNVPLLNSEQMYQALRSLGVPTQLVIYPGQYHGITTPSYIKDRYERYLAWYAKYVK
ncbi:MAG TPA: S9 family peptidase [Thermoanaerobaculia bacterium]|nr:S9 family peptidase [Thermoanaerobaculia bacterium]